MSNALRQTCIHMQSTMLLNYGSVNIVPCINVKFFFVTVHVIQKIVNWSDKKIMMVPSKSLNQPKSSKMDASSAVPAADQTSKSLKTPSVVPDVINLSAVNVIKRKRKNKREASEDKVLVSKIIQGSKVQRNARQQQEFEYLETGTVR